MKFHKKERLPSSNWFTFLSTFSSDRECVTPFLLDDIEEFLVDIQNLL